MVARPIKKSPPHHIRLCWQFFSRVSQAQWFKCVMFFPVLLQLCQSSQLFFGNRIRLLSGNWYIVIICVVLTIPSLIGSLVLMAILWSSSSTLSDLQSKLQPEMIAFSAVGPTVDIFIASAMCFHLWRLRRSGPRRCVFE